ncbi:MAG: GRAM domain-containing protein [Sporomusaceae bacterium]|nr:GRAM domain-containing protein [Sporomusaceae bacterium]
MYVFKLNDNESILKKGVGFAQIGVKAGLGALYLTTERLVFIGYERTSITSTVEEEVPLEHIEELKAMKTFVLLANAIEISTIRGRRFRINIDDRDRWIEAINEQMDKI